MALTKITQGVSAIPPAFVVPSTKDPALTDGDTVRLSWGGSKEVAITRGQAIAMVDDQSEMVGYASYASTTGGAGQTIYWVVDERDVVESLNSTEGTLRWCVDQASTGGGGRIIFDPRLPLDIQLNSTIYIPSNVTIDAPGRNVRIFGNRSFSLFRIEPIGANVSNIIVRRVKLVHIPAGTTPQTDGITIIANDATDTYGVDKIWIDQITTDRIEDGCVDITAAGEMPLACRVTISKCLFRNTLRPMLFGSTTCVGTDVGGWCNASGAQSVTLSITLY